ncbi:hypothetical protein ACWDR0_02210 [Streptomyces sp. NPDC003691]
MTQEAPGGPVARDTGQNAEQNADQQGARNESPDHGSDAVAESAAGGGRETGSGPVPGARPAGEEPGSGAGTGGGAEDAGAGERPEARLEKAVRAAEQALIEFEIAVETFRVEVENFSRLHHQKLGPMYTRLDELEAEIAEARAARTGDPGDLLKAREARAAVLPMPGVDELFHGWMDDSGISPEAAAMLTGRQVRAPQRVRPSEEARRLYRELARKAHPDLAQDESERTRREEFLTRGNAAYALGDAEELRQLIAEWDAGPLPADAGLGGAEELYARLEWLAERKELLVVIARELEDGAIGSMLRMAPDDPDRLLDEIADQLLAQVAERERELAALLG